MVQYSIIIPTFNGSSRIENTLNSLIRQSINSQEFEIIVVDDGSVDDTARVVSGFIEMHKEWDIYYLYQSNLGPGAARNFGVKKAQGDIIFFTDDDCEVPALWMEKIIEKYYQYPFVVGVGGWYRPYINEIKNNPYQEFNYLRYYLFPGVGIDTFSGYTGQYYPLPAFNTANISFKKSVFERVGGFNQVLRFAGSEDFELSERIQSFGYKLYYFPIQVLHHKKLNFVNLIKMCIVRSRGLKLYNSSKGVSSVDMRFRNNFRGFISFCNLLETQYFPFKYNRKIKNIAFLWYFIEGAVLKLPFL